MTIMLSNNIPATLTFKESRSQWKASKLIVDVACTASYPTPNFNTDDVMLFLTGTTHNPYIKAYGAGLWGEVTMNSLLWVQLLDEVDTGTQSLRELWVNEVDKYNSVLAHIQLPTIPVDTNKGIIYTLSIPVDDYDGAISFEVNVQVLRDTVPSLYITLFMVVEVDAYLNEDGRGVTGKLVLYGSNLQLEGGPITLQTIKDTVYPHIHYLASSMKAATKTLTFTLDSY
jgi:hypothetical protein